MDKMRLILGGPAYRMELDARHAGAMANLAIAAGQRGFDLEWVEFCWRHGCPVEMARNQIFAYALDAGATHLLTVDSDCFWPAPQVDGILWLLKELSESQRTPMIAVPVLQRNGSSNVVTHKNGARWERLQGSIPLRAKKFSCYAVGTGVVMYALDWYRQRWPKGPHFRTEWFPDGESVSEDFWHCLKLRELGAEPQYAPVAQIIHAARGTLPEGSGL